MQPLAYRKRPHDWDDVIGQDELVGKDGIIRKMVEQNKMFSVILYGAPGTGKTTIAKIVSSHFGLNAFEFNASSDNKQILKDIADATKYYNNLLVIIDEIHRMKKDTQDFLLPFLEDGRIIIIGLTTSNPYIAINPAIRSRCHIFQMNNIKKEDIVTLLKKSLSDPLFNDVTISDEILDFIATRSGMEIRTALNMLESLSLLKGNITLEMASKAVGMKSYHADDKDTNYYDLLSALQKSIRGSDVDASLYYLARLIRLGDLDIIVRRLSVIAYEDIGFGNPAVGPRVYAACEQALRLGFPEAYIPLSYAVIDLALSPKSNSVEASILRALDDVDNLEQFDIPKNILNREIKGKSAVYLYPHDFDGDIVYQEYMPPEIRDHVYYIPKLTGKYEKALDEFNKSVKKVLKK